jgi:hypothetical protein
VAPLDETKKLEFGTALNAIIRRVIPLHNVVILVRFNCGEWRSGGFEHCQA